MKAKKLRASSQIVLVESEIKVQSITYRQKTFSLKTILRENDVGQLRYWFSKQEPYINLTI